MNYSEVPVPKCGYYNRPGCERCQTMLQLMNSIYHSRDLDDLLENIMEMKSNCDHGYKIIDWSDMPLYIRCESSCCDDAIDIISCDDQRILKFDKDGILNIYKRK